MYACIFWFVCLHASFIVLLSCEGPRSDMVFLLVLPSCNVSLVQRPSKFGFSMPL